VGAAAAYAGTAYAGRARRRRRATWARSAARPEASTPTVGTRDSQRQNFPSRAVRNRSPAVGTRGRRCAFQENNASYRRSYTELLKSSVEPIPYRIGDRSSTASLPEVDRLPTLADRREGVLWRSQNEATAAPRTRVDSEVRTAKGRAGASGGKRKRGAGNGATSHDAAAVGDARRGRRRGAGSLSGGEPGAGPGPVPERCRVSGGGVAGRRRRRCRRRSRPRRPRPAGRSARPCDRCGSRAAASRAPGRACAARCPG
jgi:hypothetical protein